MLTKIRINDIVVSTILCSPLPTAPKYRDKITAINKLQIAEANFIEKVLKILPSTIIVCFDLELIDRHLYIVSR